MNNSIFNASDSVNNQYLSDKAKHARTKVWVKETNLILFWKLDKTVTIRKL